MSKWYKASAGLGLAAVVLAGCGSNGNDNASGSAGASGAAPSAEKATIKFMFWSDSASQSMYEELKAKFEEENPNIKVDFLTNDANTYNEKLTVTLTGGGDVDAFAFKDMPSYYKLASTGRIAELDDEVSANADAFKSVSQYFDNVKIDGKLYGLPFRNDGWAVYYNKNLFDAAGVPYPDDDLTWDEYFELAKKMTKGEGQDKIWGSFMPNWAQTWYAAGVQQGASLYADDLSPFLKGLEDRKALTDSGAQASIAENTATNAHYRTAFLTGKVAMVYTGTWFPGMLEQDKKDGKLNFEWGMTYSPHPEGVANKTSLSAVVVSGVNKNAKHQAEAIKWIGFISSEEGQQIVAKYQTPASNAETVREVFKQNFTNDSVNLDAIFNLIPVPEREVRAGISQMDIILDEEGSRALLGEITPQQAIDNIKSRRDKEITE
ncbi:sugar ABC transporter substrate-binding protein [Cohnella sp. GbtcB17]|uniref:ABC transporter substrate-binding protein n=1 Tax=Cohnella sp. GbtcB17 TaxID=2824762 RepID=UPI001C310CDA|nr:sugar ABC transporter substrate-binding protein [Cohnella sp. GbtcB17]